MNYLVFATHKFLSLVHHSEPTFTSFQAYCQELFFKFLKCRIFHFLNQTSTKSKLKNQSNNPDKLNLIYKILKNKHKNSYRYLFNKLY